MTIKKNLNSSATEAAAPGGAAIASRLRLDAPDPEAVRRAAAAAKGTKVALIFGLIAAIVAGILTYMLYQHWEFLMPA